MQALEVPEGSRQNLTFPVDRLETGPAGALLLLKNPCLIEQRIPRLLAKQRRWFLVKFLHDHVADDRHRIGDSFLNEGRRMFWMQMFDIVSDICQALQV